MAEMPNSDPLPPATAHMLQALEAFLDTPPLPCVFRCIFCHNFIAQGHNFIQNLYPFSTAQLLFDYATGVNFRERDYPTLDAYVGEAPAGSHVDEVAIYCISCGKWLGWRIIRLHAYHPVIREGQFVLACGGGLGIQVEFQM
ncbi:uncharacterized protein LOC104881747 [Vitis vinifera]|uniref:uncharacterized protein LOC104881747 n=1 Tax=Vitis vinifera TaxID=29760 RepID=UPI00053FF127|nr:uncharacterized protein LOC104881747 [Vitis vinifera]XP_059599141.1 uncharacterized protein LOC104881747 [Vitis vinifera]XP_059599142.1 uncharacterized protein LOC104881747 [Vitis vinifera]|eukprot:XP_010661227.1 PREDICTED: uncharacterized protein LOC104881747 [Vitis vinifera]